MRHESIRVKKYWLRSLIHDLKEITNNPILIYEHNPGCIGMESTRVEHINVKHTFIRDAVTKGLIINIIN